MGDSFAYLDIVLLAMVAGFLIYRLRSVLGRRTGSEKPRPDPFQAGEPAARQATATPPRQLPDRGAAEQKAVATAEPSGPIADGLRQIAGADAAFTADWFIAGARKAFAEIVEAFAKGDLAALRPLLNDDVYANFAAAIEARNRAGETHETTLVGVKSADILEARLNGRIAYITVKFVSDQVNVTRNRAAEVIEGDPVRVVTITDIWTFARDIRSRDPNWSLVATRSSN